jgi:putative N6-adenine-specific DNA methylase
VLVRLGEFNAAAFSELRKKASRLAWERYIISGGRVALRVTCRKSRLYHSGAVAERVAGAIGDRLGLPPTIENFDETATEPPSQLILVRLVRDYCTISVDSSGALLSKRGYRLASAKAPLRESLAAAILLASGWDSESPLVDPFCGSGTIPIEAALMARGMAPGAKRGFAFEKWPIFDKQLWELMREEAEGKAHSQSPIILASDRDAGAIDLARANAERAGVAADIDFCQQAVSGIESEGTGWVVTNPPYGRRVSTKGDLRNLYAQFGKVLQAKLPGWQLAVLCSDKRLLGHTGLHLETDLTFDNGGVRVRLGRGKVPG